MKKILIFIMVLSLSLVLPFKVNALENDLTKNAKSSIMIEVSTGKILYEKNAYEEVAIASLTKMMGLLIAMEKIEEGALLLDEVITISKNAKEMGGTQIYLDTGDKITVSDLLKSITMASANDSMVALSERIAGTEEAFVKMMNEKAKEMNLEHTVFKNVTGLDEEGHYSTAYDMALIAKSLVEHEQILEFTKVYEAYIREDTNKTWISNTNKLVRFYEGADGLKTGYTDLAGRCIAATAKRNNLRLIVVSLGYEKSDIRNSETMNLLDYGFNIWRANVLKNKGEIIDTVKLNKANLEKIDLVLEKDLITVEEKSNKEKEYTYNYELNNFSYPIEKGSVIGYIYAYDKENNIVAKENLITTKDIKKVNIFSLYLRNMKDIILGNI